MTAQCALWAVTSHAFDVPAQAFHPAPKVQSSVVVMESLAEPTVDVGDPKVFKSVVRALFGQRRKMVRKSLKSICSDVGELFLETGLDGRRRGETFSLDEIARLSRALSR